MTITLIAGARPNFIKIAPIVHAIRRYNRKRPATGKKMQYRLVHTGQHYDRAMSGSFFAELHIPEPDVNLGCEGGTQAEQTAAIMVAFEKELLANPADIVLVVGDVNSTLACSIVAKKLNAKVAHVEAGLRSFDLSMPEEINRMVTDSITDYYFTTSRTAGQNLLREGVPTGKIFFVGNVMIDSLVANRKKFRKPEIYAKKGLAKGNYFVLTLHRPANVDDANKLNACIKAVAGNARNLPVIFPAHPRTAGVLKKAGIKEPNLCQTEPMGYLDFNYLVEKARAVITDSGGITEETTVMGVPCMTLRDNTERPETVSIGTNMLVGADPQKIKPALDKLFSGRWKKGRVPELWDGKTADRLVTILAELNG